LLGAIVGVQAATTVTVSQYGLKFKIASVTLGKGDRIVFTNEDDVLHNIHIFGSGDEKDLGLQKPGGTLNYTFNKAGLYTVRCNIHPSVRLAVNVK
jgi:plastocyanin